MESPKGLKEFIRNPLGIIALFITMIYGVANLLLGKSVDSLTSAERWPLILFVVIFPIVVLVAFYWLVKSHHKKLYAPADFRSDESFLSAMTTHDVIDRLREEVAEGSDGPDRTYSLDGDEVSDSEETERHGTPEAQAQEIRPVGMSAPSAGAHLINAGFGEKILELARITDYMKLRYREFASNDAVSNVRIGRSKTAFDAACFDGGYLRALEVKYITKNSNPKAVIESALKNAKIAKEEVGDFRLLLVIVYDLEVRLERPLEQVSEVSKNYPYVDLVFFDRENIPV
ncbi:TPA: hypothetical protein ACGR39_003834 [Pseudomonas aeruginosa]